MKRETRLHLIIFPFWLLWLFPPAWLIVLPWKLCVSGLALFLTLTALGRADKRARMRSLLLPLWGCGLLADLGGVAWMQLGALISEFSDTWTIYDSSHPECLLWILSAVAVSGACVYGVDRFILKGELSPLPDREQRLVALAMAILTAPWPFFGALT